MASGGREMITIYARKMNSEIKGFGAIDSASLQEERLTDNENRVNSEAERDGNTELLENTPIENINGVKDNVFAVEVQDEDNFDASDLDQADKLKRKKFKFKRGKENPADDENLPCGFGEIVNGQAEEELLASVRNHNRNRETKVERQTSLKQSLKDPVMPSESSNSTASSDQFERKNPEPYPNQANIQRCVDPNAPRSQPIIEYDFSHPNRGFAVMVVNKDFRIQNTRKGAEHDLRNTKEICRKLEFRLFNYGKERNLSKAETLSMLRRAQQTDHSNCDSFLFMISTHGLEQPNVRAKGKLDHALVCADDQLIFTSSILDMFNEENCPSLRGKPKLFFIQACRGENVDDGCQVHQRDDFTDKLPLPSNRHEEPCGEQVSSTKEKQVQKKPSVSTTSLRCYNDMMVMYATTEGKVAWRSSNDGSWMIDDLHKVIMAYDMTRPKNLLSLLTEVLARMSKRSSNVPSSKEMDNKKAILVIEHKLTRHVIFRQKAPTKKKSYFVLPKNITKG